MAEVRGVRELERVLRVARPLYRAAALVLALVLAADLVLAVLVWFWQDATWPGTAGNVPAGLGLLAALLVPAGAAWWMRRRVRGGREVDAGAVVADVHALRGSARKQLTGLAEAATDRRRAWRRFVRFAWRARAVREELTDTDVPALRAVIRPFFPGTLLLLWLAGAGFVLLAIAAVSTGLDV
jgi:hypothetical protein